MSDYVAKPVRSNDLYAALARWITGVVAASEAPPVVDKTPASTDDAIDPAALDNLQKIRRPDGPDLLARVIELFLHDTPPRLAALRDTATRGSARDLARIAHTLKGSSANLGARRMVALCAELETLCQAETLDDAAGLLGKLEAEFERVRNRLQTRVKAG
ncbi:MAG: Hpt domain-containing protein [Gammaproteobacteria bacterium]|nr:Hpt domain-containing protein [Gammaproteobacteria bacterium]